MSDNQQIVFQSIQQPTVVDQIIDIIKDALIRGELTAGQKLPSEPDLARQLGVGRSAVREALKVLQAIGVVESRRGSGTYIVEKPSGRLLNPLAFAIMLGTDVSSELIELRVMIQIGYCELAASQATEDDWTIIEQTASAMENGMVDNVGHERLAHLDLDFHYAILEATHNPLVQKIGRTVEELFFSSIRDTFREPKNVEQAVQAHRAIINALRSQDLQQIRTAIVNSLNDTPWKDEVKTLRRIHLNGQ
ncbi:MAG: FadR/GntR family transcriptional regulator [Chloroflexota bacterium]